MLSDGFSQAAPLLPLRAFNHLPQCLGLGRTSQGAYTFAGNVALEALRLVSQGFQAPAFRRGVTDLTPNTFKFAIQQSSRNLVPWEETNEILV